MNIREIENLIVEKLQQNFSDFQVIGFPEKPQEYILLHPIGAILVHYIQFLKDLYPAGTRVKLVEMNDIQAPPIGTLGTVMYVDDIGTIHIKWDNGSTLGAAYPEDRVTKI